MMKKTRLLIYAALLLVGLASCSKKVADKVTADTTTEVSGGSASSSSKKDKGAEAVKKVNETRTNLSQLSAHISLDLSAGSQNVKVGGELKMKRNCIIQITLQALGLITVGRLEFTPETMMVMDNMNKRFVNLPYSEVPFLKENGIDFYTFQSLLWDELFVPGGKDSAPKTSDFKQRAEGKDVVLTLEQRNLLLSFLANPDSGRLRQSSIKGVKGNNGMECEYLSWANVKNASFPSKYKVKVGVGAQSIQVNLDMSKLRVDDSWKGTPTKVDSKKFQELSLQQVWSAVMSLAK